MDGISVALNQLEGQALQQVSKELGKRMEKTFPEYKRMSKNEKRKVLTTAKNLLVTGSSLSAYVRMVSYEEPISWLVDTAKGAYLYGMQKALKRVRILPAEKIDEIVRTASQSALVEIGRQRIMQDPENIHSAVNVIDSLGLLGDYIRENSEFFFGILENMPTEVRRTWAKTAFDAAYLKILDEHESQIKQECYEK